MAVLHVGIMKKLKVIVLGIVLLPLAVYAQNTVGQVNAISHFDMGLELYVKEKYALAQHEFELYQRQHPNGSNYKQAEFHEAMCALKLFQPHGPELLESFIENNPNNENYNIANFELGDFFYNARKGKYKRDNFKRSIQFLSKVKFNELPDDLPNEGRFKLGYAYFTQKEFNKALPLFERAKNSDNRFVYAANYYAGYINFRNGNYTKALSEFKVAEGQPSFKKLIPYMKVNILHRQKKWKELTAYADNVLAEQPNVKHKDVIQLLAAESHFRQKNYEYSAKYFEEYKKKKKGDDNITYRLAYSLYKLKEYKKAIQEFKQLSQVEDTLKQYTSYYLGVCYIQTKNKEYALGAFVTAGSLDYNTELKYEALFNVAKINYENKDFSAAISALQRLLDMKISSGHVDEINELLSQSYLRTNDYDKAIVYIESLKPSKKSRSINSTYQKVTFYRAVEYFNAKEYSKALKYFDKSLSQDIDKEYTVAARFWKAEIASMNKEWNNAINLYAAVFRSPAAKKGPYFLKSRYGIGYAYFNTTKYEDALRHFEKFIEGSNPKQDRQIYSDALVRLGDCHFKKREYTKALNGYNSAIQKKVSNADYALTQQGKVLVFLERESEAITSFRKVVKDYPSSPYKSSATFYLARTLFEQKRFQEAIPHFTSIIAEYEGGAHIPQSLLNRGICYHNTKMYQEAVGDYDKILAEYCNTSYAKDAISAVQRSLKKLPNSDSLLEQRLTVYEECNPGSDETIEIRFKALEHKFDYEKYAEVLKLGTKFRINYPNSHHEKDVTYYMAEAYFQEQQYDNALEEFTELINDPKYDLYVKSLARAGAIYVIKEDFESSVKTYKKLLGASYTRKLQLVSLQGLTKGYFNTQEYDSTIYYAEQTLKSMNSIISARNTALLYKAHAIKAKGDTVEAVKQYSALFNERTEIECAEAGYNIAYTLFEQGKYEQCRDTCRKLKKEFKKYLGWSGEAWVLIADSYLAEGETYQGKSTLETLVNFPDPEIAKKVKERLDKLNTEKEKVEEEVFEDEVDKDEIKENTIKIENGGEDE